MKRIPLNDGWKWTENKGAQIEVTLPHDASIAKERTTDAASGKDGGWFAGVLGTYGKTLDCAAGMPAYLVLDGCAGLTEVWINRQRACFHPNPYTPIVCRADICRGETGHYDVEVRVNSTAQPASRWYVGTGLYRGAQLYTAQSEAFIPPYGLYVRTQSASEKSALIAATAEIVSMKDTSAKVCVTVKNAEGTSAAYAEKYAELKNGSNSLNFEISVPDPVLWSADCPYMYTAEVCVEAGGKADAADTRFGIVTVSTDPQKGLMINGSPVKLYGGCLHHDNGPLGAVSLYDAERRKLMKLKQAGFNAVRCSHNPPSTALLDACDDVGIMVIDEAFDCWRQGKQPFDYHIFFDEWFERDLEAMLLRDRNHPSVVMWSQGNEIPERAGDSGGHDISRRITEIIRRFDSRPITHALCSFWDNPVFSEKQAATEHLTYDAWCESTSGITRNLDITGYNYALSRAVKDRLSFTDRVCVLTETMPMDAREGKEALESLGWVAGDFVWTAWDYFGESGIGHVKYDTDEARGLMLYPWHISNCGDFDINGEKRPQSYYRDIVYGRRTAPYMITDDPRNSARGHAVSPWGFYPGEASWNWEGCEGMESEVHVFSASAQVEAVLNGESMGISATDQNHMAVFRIKYRPGTLTAYAIDDGGKRAEEFTLSTTGGAQTLSVCGDYMGNEATWLRLTAADAQGRTVSTCGSRIKMTVDGEAVFAGLSNGKPDETEAYGQSELNMCRGILYAVIRHKPGMCPNIRFVSEDGLTCEYIQAR